MSTPSAGTATAVLERPQPPVAPLAGFTAHCGVLLCDIGEDGDVVMLGHVDNRYALAALNRHARLDWSAPEELRHHLPWLPLSSQLHHGWAVNTGDACDWNLEDTSRDAPDAFPVTWFTA